MTKNIQKFTLANLHNETFTTLSQVVMDANPTLPQKDVDRISTKYIETAFRKAAAEYGRDSFFASNAAGLVGMLPSVVGIFGGAALIDGINSIYNAYNMTGELPQAYINSVIENNVTSTAGAAVATVVGLGLGIKFFWDAFKLSREDNKISKALGSKTDLQSLSVDEDVYKNAFENIQRHISKVKNGTAQLALVS